MPLIGFNHLYQFADGLRSALSVVVAGGADPTVLEAMSLAQRRGWVEPILTGNVHDTQRLADDLNIDLSGFCLIESDEPAVAAVAAVKTGRAQMLMKGQIATRLLMKAVLARDTGLRTDKSICQVVMMEILRDKRCFLLSDTGITIQPSLREPSSLECPRIAVVSATESATEAMPDTIDAVELTRRAVAGEFAHCVVQGPLSFDLAYAVDAGEKKKIDGSVVGSADAMLFPDLLSANLTVKAIMYTANCCFGGILCGTSCPVVFMSRADTTSTRLNSLAMSLRLLVR